MGSRPDCECIGEVDEALKSRNARLSLALVFQNPTYETVQIATDQIEKGRGKPKAPTMFASHCPFCGKAYKD